MTLELQIISIGFKDCEIFSSFSYIVLIVFEGMVAKTLLLIYEISASTAQSSDSKDYFLASCQNFRLKTTAVLGPQASSLKSHLWDDQIPFQSCA